LAAEGATTIIATDNGWDSQKFHNAIAALVIEHAYDGYRFDVSTASSTMNWQSIIAGDVDLDIESWTDNVASYPDDVAKGDIVNVGVLVGDSAQGIYVPRYVIEGDPSRGIEPKAPGLKSVADIGKYAEVFPDEESPDRGRLFGSIPGWMADEILHKKYEFYGLDKTFNYVRLGSEASLFASLVSAYNLGEPWLGYCYEPTWVVGRLDLVRLEDAPYEPSLFLEGKCAFPSQELRIVSNKWFAEKAPDLVEFLKRYRTSSAMISAALAYLEESRSSYGDLAVWFLKNNDSLLDEWLPAENAAKLRGYLATL
jgi:glycine betaine/proline transport system permease protein/glycine betaine/proline transport system substrate-binding protein